MLQRKTKRRTQHSIHTRRDAMWAAEAARVRIDILNIPFPFRCTVATCVRSGVFSCNFVTPMPTHARNIQ